MLRTAFAILSAALVGGPAGAAAASGAVAASAEAVRPVAVGEAAPSATCRDVDGNAVRLDTWIGREAVVLVFYRGGW